MNPHSVPPPESDRDPSAQASKVAQPPTSEPPRRGRGWIVFVVLLIAAGVGFYYWRKAGGSIASATTDAKAGKAAGAGNAVPVIGTRARAREHRRV